MRTRNLAIIILLSMTLAGCSTGPRPLPPQPAVNQSPDQKSEIKVTSVAFQQGQPIPRQYTCAGVNISPPLEWSGLPKTAKTIAIVVNDPDAPGGSWIHWVLYNVPADNIGFVENVPVSETLKAGGFQGKNDFGKIGYGGPCPPSGTHRYFFKLYAVDAELPLKAGATWPELEKALDDHVVGQGQLMGTYQR
jgi:Raf kinase inhibitor-like YbhB/YbcL family protein